MSGRDMIGKILISKIKVFLKTNYFIGFFYLVENIKMVLKKSMAETFWKFVSLNHLYETCPKKFIVVRFQ